PACRVRLLAGPRGPITRRQLSGAPRRLTELPFGNSPTAAGLPPGICWRRAAATVFDARNRAAWRTRRARDEHARDLLGSDDDRRRRRRDVPRIGSAGGRPDYSGPDLPAAARASVRAAADARARGPHRRRPAPRAARRRTDLRHAAD